MYEWYQATDHSPSHNAAIRLYVRITGDWVFRTLEWDDWIHCRNRALWVPGIPGAGKTVLVSHIIKEIVRTCDAKGDKIASAYYYCYHGYN